MKKHIFLIVQITYCFILNAQVTFQKTYDISGGADGRGIATRQTSDGGYIIGAETGPGISDFYILKTNSSGVVTWNKTFGGDDDDDIYDILQTNDGGYFISGSTKSFGAGLTDVYAIKLDGSGNITWSGAFGGSNYDAGTSSIQTSDGGYVITGWTSSFGTGGEDLYIIKLNSSGSLQWSRTIGGTLNDEGRSIVQTTDGGYVITGNTKSFGTGNKDVYIIKLDGSGNVSWTKTYGGTGDDFGNSIKQTTDGGYVLGCTYNGSQMWLIKTDGSGTIVWNKLYTQTGCNGDNIISVVQTTDGGYAFTGNIVNCVAGAQNISLIKTDNSGSLQWSKAYGGAAGEFTHSSMQQTSGNGFIITGDTKTLAASGSWDVYLIKTDANGSSGCNQSSPVFNVTSPIFTTNSGGTPNNGGSKSSAGTIVTTPLTTLTPICIFYPEGGETGIEDFLAISNINLYPNPASNESITIKIKANNSFESNIKLNDIYGRIIYEQNENIISGENIIALNTSSLPNGLIVAKITNVASSEQLQIKFLNLR